MEYEKIGVLLPVYAKDDPSYLTLALDSVINQTYNNIVIYIGVDGTVSEKIKSVIYSYTTDLRVKPIWFPENRGLAKTLNDLIKFALYDNICVFARMDADDISIKDRFEKQLRFLNENPEIDVVGGAITEIDEAGKSRNKTIIYPHTPKECFSFFSRRNPHAHPAVMFRKSFFDKIGHYYRPEYRQNQDTMLWYDGFINGTLNANIDDVVLKFRMTKSLFKKRRNGWKFAKKQFKDRLEINKSLKYDFRSNIFGFAMFILQLAPAWSRKVAYRIFR